MTIDSDDNIALPMPPPPRPAARRTAIEAALRRFDGAEATPAGHGSRKPTSGTWWADLRQRPAAGFVAAALLAVVCIPAVQIALRDSSSNGIPQVHEPQVAESVQDSSPCAGANCPNQARSVIEQQPAQPDQPLAAALQALPARDSTSSPAAKQVVSANASQEDAMETSAPPPPLPPPPPPPPPSPQAPEMTDNIIVTGSRIPAPNLSMQGVGRVAERKAEFAKSLAGPNASREFLSRLQVGLRANDRRAVIGLIGLPLRVNLTDGPRTYRSRREIDRDFDRIFTARVRLAVLDQPLDALVGRDGSGTIGNGRLRFGLTCSYPPCSSSSAIRISEVSP